VPQLCGEFCLSRAANEARLAWMLLWKGVLGSEASFWGLGTCEIVDAIEEQI
jgi:hypothetical protein